MVVVEKFTFLPAPSFSNQLRARSHDIRREIHDSEIATDSTCGNYTRKKIHIHAVVCSQLGLCLEFLQKTKRSVFYP